MLSLERKRKSDRMLGKLGKQKKRITRVQDRDSECMREYIQRAKVVENAPLGAALSFLL